MPSQRLKLPPLVRKGEAVYTLSKEEVSITHRIGLEVSDLPPFRALLRASLKIRAGCLCTLGLALFEWIGLPILPQMTKVEL